MYQHEEMQSIGKYARVSQGVSDNEMLKRGPVIMESEVFMNFLPESLNRPSATIS
jgi:hypothetical protein